MVNKLSCLVFLLMSVVSLAQAGRQVLQGRVIADSISVEGVSVQNIATNAATVTNAAGHFILHARSGDTLFFYSITFHPRHVSLKQQDFEEGFVVQLDAEVTTLDEVIISGLTGNLAADSKSLDLPDYNAQFDPKILNSDAMITQSVSKTAYGADLIGLAVNLVGLLVKKEDEPRRYEKPLFIPDKTFGEAVKDRFKESYFTETLKIPADRINLFLHFCDSGAVRHLLSPDNDMKLILYLQDMAVEYRKREKL